MVFLMFYSKALKRVTVAIGSARKLWHLTADIRLEDGAISGFIVDPANYALEALDKTRYAVQETIEVLNYNKDKLHYKVEWKTQSAEERRSEPRSDMVGIREQLRSLAQSRHDQTKNVEQYMEESKEWLVA